MCSVVAILSLPPFTVRHGHCVLSIADKVTGAIPRNGCQVQMFIRKKGDDMQIISTTSAVAHIVLDAAICSTYRLGENTAKYPREVFSRVGQLFRNKFR